MDLRKELDDLYLETMRSELVLCQKDGFHLDYQSVLYLELIRLTDGCTVGDLAKTLGVDKSTVSRKVEKLVSGGYVEKSRDPGDGRIQRLSVSKQREEICEHYDAQYDRVLERISREFTEDEVQTICRAVRIMVEELRRDDVR